MSTPAHQGFFDGVFTFLTSNFFLPSPAVSVAPDLATWVLAEGFVGAAGPASGMSISAIAGDRGGWVVGRRAFGGRWMEMAERREGFGFKTENARRLEDELQARRL